MKYLLIHKRSYDNDFISLPKDLQWRVTQAVRELEEEPITPRGNTIKKLRGWKDLWRYRIDDYRLIYHVPLQQPIVQLLAIGPRKDVYDRFYFDPNTPENQEINAYTDLTDVGPTIDTPEWQKHPEWFQPKPDSNHSVPLPTKLSPSLLSKWLIPSEYHSELMRCLTDEDLLNTGVPDSILARIMDILWPAPIDHIADQPDQILFRPEDLERYAEGTLLGFLLRLDDQQQKFTDWALAGPTLLKGGPGSGKSTVALYRVRAIVQNAMESCSLIPSVLFTTFTNALVNFSEQLLIQLLSGYLELEADRLPGAIQVTTVDKVVRRIVRSATNPDVANHEQQRAALHSARTMLQPRLFGDSEKLAFSQALNKLGDEYLLEEFDSIIEGQGCVTEESYLAANRELRTVGLDQRARRAVWQLYQRYRELLESDGLTTWGQLRRLALERVRAGLFSQKWDYVVVDEAQDLTPTALALCVELCKSPSGLFLTADANQSLYNRGFRWQNVHEQLRVRGRTRILRRNYRSTWEIAIAARDLLAGSRNADDEALEQDFAHRGRPPVVHGADGVAGQATWLARQIVSSAKELRLPVSTAAVLVPANWLGEPFAEELRRMNLPAQFMKSAQVQPKANCIKVLTLHAAKGLEFPIVAIAHVDAGSLPYHRDFSSDDEQAEYLDGQRQLLYVGCTRAMRYLFVTHDRAIPSPFLTLFSTRHWMRS